MPRRRIANLESRHLTLENVIRILCHHELEVRQTSVWMPTIRTEVAIEVVFVLVEARRTDLEKRTQEGVNQDNGRHDLVGEGEPPQLTQP